MKREEYYANTDKMEYVRETVILEGNETIFLRHKDNNKIISILNSNDKITFVWNRTTKSFCHAFVNGLSIFEVKPFYQELGFGLDTEILLEGELNNA